MSKNITENATKMGDKFYLEVMGATSARQAAKAFSIVERSYKLALDAQKHIDDRQNFNLLYGYIGSLTEGVKRSQAWLEYLLICDQFSVPPLGKIEFFDKLREFDVEIKIKTGEYYLFPPKNQPAVLQENAKLLIEYRAKPSSSKID